MLILELHEILPGISERSLVYINFDRVLYFTKHAAVGSVIHFAQYDLRVVETPEDILKVCY